MKKWIKILIWTYIVLLIVEGALRKWVLPQLADPLLIVRDPVVIAIYVLALLAGIFPMNGFVMFLGAMAALSAIQSILAGQTNLLVTAYGLRINYLHLPLMWIMGSVFTRKDVERIGTFFLFIAIPMTWVMVLQFRAPMDAWINRGVGNDELGIGQIFGADGRIRPPGLFSFITGPQLFIPLCVAFFFDQLSGKKRMPWYLLIICGLALAIALPVSISRTVMIGSGVVAAVFLLALPFSSSKAAALVRPMILLILVGVALSQLPVFKEGWNVFMMRWDQAKYEAEGAAWGSLFDRVLLSFTNTIYFIEQAPLFGYGVGVGSNVGTRLLSGELGFGLAEEEWGKVLLELGPLLGAAFIGFRIWLAGHLLMGSWRALRLDRNALPLLIWSALMIAIVQGQWAPPTVLGFAVLGGGLIFAAMNPDEVAEPVEESEEIGEISEPIFAEPSHAPLPGLSDRRPPVVVRSTQK